MAGQLQNIVWTDVPPLRVPGAARAPWRGPSRFGCQQTGFFLIRHANRQTLVASKLWWPALGLVLGSAFAPDIVIGNTESNVYSKSSLASL